MGELKICYFQVEKYEKTRDIPLDNVYTYLN